MGMEEREKSDLWKAEIEHALDRLQELREQLHPVDFSSELWEEYTGACGDVREDVAFLFCPREILPETDKLNRLDFADKEADWIIFDNLCEKLSHQMSFYQATFLAVPYLVLLFEKKRREGNLEWQYRIISKVGEILATTVFFEEENNKQTIHADILTSYRLSVDLFRQKTKTFLEKNIEQLKEKSPVSLQYFCTSLLAVFGAVRDAYQLFLGNWEQVPLECPACGYYDEELEDGFYQEETIKEKIIPAKVSIGEWNGKWDSIPEDDPCLWLGSLANMLGIRDEWKIPYYYGTYTCPKCGKKSKLMELHF